MYKNLLEKAEKCLEENNLTVEEFLEQTSLLKKQINVISSNLGGAINGGIDIALKAILPDFIEDEVINIKNTLITEGFSAALDIGIEEVINVGKSIQGMLTGSFENIEQIKKAVEKGGLIDTVSDLLDTSLDWAKKNGYIEKDVASAIKKGKNGMMDIIKDNVDDTLENQVVAIEKIDGYINKWKEYYLEENFTNMEYQYKKIQEYIKDVIPLEETLKKARVVENLHELIKNNGKDFDLTEQEKELAEMLTN